MTLHLSDEPRLKRPAVIERDDEPADPSLAEMPEDLPPRALLTAQRLARPTSPLARFSFWVFSSLLSLVVSVAAWNFVTGLFAANTVLGWVAFTLFALALALLAIFALKELASFARMARLDRMRVRAAEVRASHDIKGARALVAGLHSLYASRADQAWGLARLAEREAEVFDADALLDLAEVEVMAPLDRAALAEIEKAARQVATVTAFVPLALADLATALYANLRLIRRLAELYGGRSGSFGSWRLMRRVFSALLGAGAIALADDLVGSVAGGGLLGKLSRRFGEGVVNGALTTRVGLAAMELSRPMPFAALPKPGVSATVSRALAGLFGRAAAEKE